MILRLLFLFLLFHCSFPIQEKYQRAILEDSFFIKNKENIKAINLVKNYKLNEAEKEFLELLKKSKSSSITFLNLFHFYFILDEYDLARKTTQDYLNFISYNFNYINFITNTFEKYKREEEKIIFLDVLFENLKYRTFAGKKIGKYFLKKRDYKKAFFYYDKVLIFQPLDKEARFAMVKMAYSLEKWKDLLKFVESLQKSNDIEKNLYYFGAKANYELKNYYKASSYINLDKYNYNKDIFYLKLWEDTLLSIDLKRDLKFLDQYKNSIKDHSFIYNIPLENRKNITNNLLIGF